MLVPQLFLARGGLSVSRIVQGMMNLASWNWTVKERRAFIEFCLEHGISTFDHADIYGGYTCEALFGEVLAEAPHLRQRMQIVTKCGIKLVAPARPEHTIKHYDTSRAHIIVSVENSLRALRTDYIDLLLIHRPDPLMDADLVAEAFAQLHAQGKVRFFGVSNFTPSQFSLLQSRVPFPLQTNQVEWSLLHLDPMFDGTFDQAQELRRAPMVWSPVAGGRLFRGEDERARRVRLALHGLAAEMGVPPDTVALAWLLRHPVQAVPVLGTGNRERILNAVRACTLNLPREDWFALLVASLGEDVP